MIDWIQVINVAWGAVPELEIYEADDEGPARIEVKCREVGVMREFNVAELRGIDANEAIQRWNALCRQVFMELWRKLHEAYGNA